MPITIVCFRQILCDQRVGQMAVHANGRAMMGSLGPGSVLVVHDVAVCACPGIRREVTQPFAVVERKSANAEYQPGKTGNKELDATSHDSLYADFARMF